MISVEAHRQIVSEIITKHEPENKHSIDNMMDKWESKENDLLTLLCDKYNEKLVDIPTKLLKQSYVIGTKIGSGSFSTVRLCKNRDNGKQYALKIISKKRYAPKDLIMIDFEVSILRKISHKNIIKLHDVFKNKSKICLIMDFFNGGTLFDRISERGKFTETEARKTFTEMIDGLKYLHSMDYVHRDIKPENFLFVSNDANATVKLIDFGFARCCKKGALETQCGSAHYAAPELLQGIKYDTQCDMWSIGVILYIMLCGYPPFHDENDKVLHMKIKTAEYSMDTPEWYKISHNAKDLVSKLLQIEPQKRLTAQQSSEWMKECNGEQENMLESKGKVIRNKNIRPSNVKRLSQTFTNGMTKTQKQKRKQTWPLLMNK